MVIGGSDEISPGTQILRTLSSTSHRACAVALVVQE